MDHKLKYINENCTPSTRKFGNNNLEPWAKQRCLRQNKNIIHPRKQSHKLNFLKIKNIYTSKDTHKKMKRGDTSWKKILVTQISDQDFVS